MNIQARRPALVVINRSLPPPAPPPPSVMSPLSIFFSRRMCLIIIYFPCYTERPKDSDLPRGQSLYASETIGEGITVSIREEGKL